MKQLFLSHYSKHGHEVAELARELRFRGVRPWVDKQGGFLVADDSAVEAERAIREDCLGLLLYATDDVFSRDFIRDHEIPPALQMREADPRFLLLAVPRNLSFQELSDQSSKVYGSDLSRYHTRPANGCWEDARIGLTEVAGDVLAKVMQLAELNSEGKLGIQFSTREVAPPEEGEGLTIDGTEAYLKFPGSDADSFNAFVHGMRDVKRAVAKRFGRPELLVHGFKHLSAAFLFGRVFQPFSITVRQTPSEYWRVNFGAASQSTLVSTVEMADQAAELVVQVSSGFKNLTPAVDEALSGKCFHRLILSPATTPLVVDENLCATMVRDAYMAIEKLTSFQSVERIHIFAAAPQAFMMGLGQRFAGMPETAIYDFDGSAYSAPKNIPGGVL
ncbi:MAG: SAVED domain-containing protein [Fimbriimonadaceae bacterium]|nr:SAVED domain-containing protein [Fimbriimonadaceae bacterium]